MLFRSNNGPENLRVTVLSGQTIRAMRIFMPFYERTRHESGLTYGLGPAGYDVRIAEEIKIWPQGFILASTVEHFTVPDRCIGVVHDKSTWARRGLAVQNTVAEPGWRGHLTLELTCHGHTNIYIARGTPIAQIVFYWLDHVAERPYEGRYQDQPAGAQPATYLKGDEEKI